MGLAGSPWSRDRTRPSEETKGFDPILRLSSGGWHAAIDHSARDGTTGETGEIVNVQFVHDLLPMFFNCFDDDAQQIRHFLIRIAVGNDFEEFDFTSRQGIGFLTVRSIHESTMALVAHALHDGR